MNYDGGKIEFTSGVDTSGLERDIRRAQNSFSDLNNNVRKECSGIDGSIKAIGASIAGVFTVQQAASFAKKVVEVRGEIESLEKSFEILAGKTQGKKLFGEIKDFAVTTPMAMGDLAKGAQTLLSFNVAAEDVMPIMRAIGDIAMGDAQKFNSLTLAFAQMQSTGKLMGQDLLQMINAGFNPLSIISEKTGKSIGALKEEMAAGAISADMITQAFMDATSEGGKFHGMMEAQSKGIKGSISNLEGAIEDMFNSIGESSQGIITGSIQTAQKLVENYDKVGRILKEFIIVYGTYKAALIATNAVQKFVISLNAGWTASELLKYKALLLVEKAQKLLNATILKNPYVLAAAAIAGLVYALYKAYHAEDQTRAATEDHAEAIDNLNKKYEDEKQTHESVISLLNDETASRITQIQALENLDEPYRKIIEKYQDEKGHISDVIALQKELNETRANAKLKENSQQLKDYERTLNDYKKLKYANEQGWSWANAGTDNNVNDLLADLGVFESNSKFLDEKISYWSKMVEQQRNVVEADKEAKNKTDLMNLTDEELIAEKQEIEVLFDLAVKNAKNSGHSDEEIKDVLGTVEDDASYQAVIKEMERRAAGTPDLIKNRAYWEQYMKEQQSILNAMTEEELLTEKAAEIKSNIIEAQSKIDAYNAKESKDTTDQEIAERNKKILQYKEAVSREARQAQLDIRQAEIDAMQEGVDKELKQNELNYDRLIEANIRRQEDMVEALRDVRQLEWENENPNAKEEGKTFDRSSVTVSDLSPEQLNILKEYERIASNIRLKADKECIDNMLSNFLTYEQKRAKITEDYERKRKSLYVDGDVSKGLRDGVTQGNVEEVDMQYNETINTLNEEMLSRSTSYKRWLNEISSMTIRQLRELLETSKKALENIKKNPSADPQKLAEAEAKVNALSYAIENADLSPNEEEFQQWEMYSRQLDDVGKSLSSLGDDMGGVAGEALSMLGTIITSTSTMIESIADVASNCMKAMSSTATSASKAIAAAQSSVAILAIIQAIYSAVVQLRDFIDNNFNTDDGFGKFASDFLHFLTDSETMLENLAWSLLGPLGTIIGMLNSTNKNSDRQKHIKETESLLNSYEDLSRTINEYGDSAEKSFGASKAALIENQIEAKKMQIELLKTAITAEQSVKNPDQDKIDQWNEMIYDLEAEISNFEESAEDAIFGETITTAIENFGDALADAWSNGTSASEAANKYMRNMIKQTVMQAILDYTQASSKIEAIRQKLQEYLANDGIISAEEQAGLENMTQELIDSVNEKFEWAQGLFGDDFSQDSTKKGFQAMSQDSADELNGRFTAIQIDTSNIKSLCDSILINTQFIVNAVVAMRQNSDEIKNLALVALDYLEAISRNTYELYEMNERLGKIEQNTRNL